MYRWCVCIYKLVNNETIYEYQLSASNFSISLPNGPRETGTFLKGNTQKTNR